ncbi:MAG: HNH endonuclease [Synergistaceae bacterium]|nr:HNH endonuclease [Synergistaceae bacterium]
MSEKIQKNLAPTSIDELCFEERDLEIFSIPDVRTKIDTVQNYFFPRLEFLVRYALDGVSDIYGINPYEDMSFVYRPNNRKKAKDSMDFDEAYMGIAGKRRTDRLLTIIHKDGKPFSFHPTYLTFNIDPDGYMSVQLLPFRYYVDKHYIETFAEILEENQTMLEPIWSSLNISHTAAMDELMSAHRFLKTKGQDSYFIFQSPLFYFPVDTKRGLHHLIWVFVALYPLLDTLFLIAEGKQHRLPELLEKFKETWLSPPEENEEEQEEESAPADNVRVNLDLPELDSYSFTRAGLWWSILARDNWTCCSCGRTAKDGVTLHVDHIHPRSLGGTNDPNNLQTLCLKCNIGKSNKDNTDLRQKNETFETL